MSKMNLLINLKGYEGDNANTSRSLFNKDLQHVGIRIDREIIQEVEVLANSTRQLFAASEAPGIPTPASAPIPSYEKIVLASAQDLNYIEINKKIIPNSIILANGKVLGVKDDDYELQIVGTTTKIIWTNDWAIGGSQANEIGETISIWYSYYEGEQTIDPDPYAGVTLFKFFYMEADKECEVIINGTIRNIVKPVVINGVPKKGVLLISADINDVIVVNDNDSSLIVYFITAK
jgi:hypothetical protein